MCPPTFAWNRSGYIVGEWLPHTPISVTSVTGTSSLLASCAIARLWSRRIIEVKRSRGTSGALFIAIRQFVFAGLPTTSTFRSAAAVAFSALPWAVKILPFSESSSARSMPFVRGREPTSSAMLAPSKPSSGLSCRSRCGEQREGAVDELHRDALERAHRLGDLEQAQVDGLVGAEQLSAGDAEHEAVADLAGGAGDGHTYGVAHKLHLLGCGGLGFGLGGRHPQAAAVRRFSSIERRNSSVVCHG